MHFINYFMVACIATFSLSVLAESFPQQPYLAVTGIASLEVQPDQLIIKFKAIAIDENGREAKNRVDQQVENLLVNLQQAGFNTELLERADLYSRAEYDRHNDKRTLVGIRATRDLTYLLSDLHKVNELLDAVLSADIDTIDSLAYGLRDPKQWQLKVQQMAITDSMEKAAVLAKAYHAELGKIYSINYQNSYAQPMMMQTKSNEMMKTTYQAKTIKLNDRVQAVFLLTP